LIGKIQDGGRVLLTRAAKTKMADIYGKLARFSSGEFNLPAQSS